MRLRNIKGSREFIENSPYVIQQPETCRGSWNRLFPGGNPIHIEIGMGKGRFIHELALANRDINYIGIEMYSSVLYRALEKREKYADLDNLCFLRLDARNLPDVFAPGEINRIYLNFSDPWPKDRHAKRRLTSPDFLKIYSGIIDDSGKLQFKTDNRPLFDYSVESVNSSGLWHIDEITYDLHNSPYIQGNIMTEYETRFVSEGKPICRFLLSKS